MASDLDKQTGDALVDAHKLQGAPPGNKPQYALTNWFRDLITDRNDPEYKKIDWLKVGLLGGASAFTGLVGFGALGVGGMALLLPVGAIGMSFGAQWLADWIKEQIDGPRKTPIPILAQTPYPDPDKKVVSSEPLELPEINLNPKKIDKVVLQLPHYNPQENKGLPSDYHLEEARRQVEGLRAVAEKGYPYPNNDTSREQAAANAMLRGMVAALDTTLKGEEINLRFTRDTMLEQLQQPNEEVKNYLAGLGVRDDARQRLAFQSDIEKIQNTPGQAGGLTQELKDMGEKNILAIVAMDKGKTPDQLTAEEIKTATAGWKLLSAGNQRIVLDKFVKESQWMLDSIDPDFREFFPELGWHLKQFDKPGARAIWVDDPRADHSEKNAVSDAYQRQDWKQLADLLENRLNKPETDSNRLSPQVKQNLRFTIIAYRALYMKPLLEQYENGQFQQELQQLDTFKREILPAYAQHVDTLRGGMQTLRESKLLLESQTPLQDMKQTFTLRDVRSTTPQVITVEVVYKDTNGAVDHLSIKEESANKTFEVKPASPLPAGDNEKVKALGRIIAEAEKTAAPPKKTAALSFASGSLAAIGGIQHADADDPSPPAYRLGTGKPDISKVEI